MNYEENLIKNHLKKEYPDFHISKKLPNWILNSHWRPSYVLTTTDNKKTLAIDVIFSGTIPAYQYATIVFKLIKEHRNFSVAIITFEESFENFPEIKEFCKDFKIGLKTIIPAIGIQTIIETPFDIKPKIKKLPMEKGWFPSAILKQSYGLKKCIFSKKINNYINELKKIGDDEEKTRTLVIETIDKLLQHHPSFKKTIGQFMKLAHFEELFKGAGIKNSDHVLHSFRVFLAGCPVIEIFYDHFQRAQRRFCIGNENDISIEYAWLLTSIFHDTGRPKEGAREMVELLKNELDDDDSNFSALGKISRWSHSEYIQARRILGSLGNFIANAGLKARWDGGTYEGKVETRISSEWIRIYNEFNRHGIMSGFDFLAETCKNASASNQTKHRPFIASHAAPAAMAIMLHDWKTWDSMKKFKLIPVDMPKFPMAALLIYIDTWDNYKRKGSDPLTFIKDYCINSDGACVKVEWGNLDLMKKDEIGYLAYKKALKNLLFSLNIKYGMAGTL